MEVDKRQEAISAIVDYIYENDKDYAIIKDGATVSCQTYKTWKDEYAMTDIGIKFKTVASCRDNWLELIDDIYNALLKRCNKA